MKGKIFKNKYGKLSLRGEDGQFYMIGKSLQDYGDGAEVEFDVTETVYNGKEQKWANAPQQSHSETKVESTPPCRPSETNMNSNDLLIRIVKGIAMLLKEQEKTNTLLGELLKKGGNGTIPVRPKAPSQENSLSDIPF